MANGREKSDLAIVAKRSANKGKQSPAESVERRAGAEGNAGRHSTRRAQNRESVSQALNRVREVARREEGTVQVNGSQRVAVHLRRYFSIQHQWGQHIAAGAAELWSRNRPLRRDRS
jgi:hypothetical protein